MARRPRYAYMADPRFNPPNNDCPECKEPSKTLFIGGKTVDGIAIYTWNCEHKHSWIITKVRA